MRETDCFPRFFGFAVRVLICPQLFQNSSTIGIELEILELDIGLGSGGLGDEIESSFQSSSVNLKVDVLGKEGFDRFRLVGIELVQKQGQHAFLA